MTALDQAVRVCSWQENLPGDEMPPRWMWHLDWKLEEWFKQVESKREQKYGGKTNKIPDYDDDNWDSNELAAAMRK